MSKKLMIVESPAKAKKIQHYLGSEFTVKPSVGHVRDLPKKGLNIKIVETGDAHWTFQPTYEISADKKAVVADLRKAAREADEIYLAPDPDREGEAIAWHLDEVLRGETKGKPVRRVTYNEITQSAVRAAVAAPREIDMHRVDAQQARRVLDRLVGFKVSPLLWKNLKYGFTLSAGRVQSVALRLLVEREREIKHFKPVEYWVMGVEAQKGEGPSFIARLARVDGAKPEIRRQDLAATYIDDLDGSKLLVKDVAEQPRVRHALPPFTTSTLQQAASSVCGFTPHRTMSMAQKLYENGLITYMRTDGVSVAEEARAAAKKLIVEKFGATYYPEKPNFYRAKAGAQEAHEAIRPTDVTAMPGTLALDAAMAKLYDLIWRRFVASQMAEAQMKRTTVSLLADKDRIGHDYLFTASTTAVVFPGFLKVMQLAKKKTAAEGEDGEDSDEVTELPPLAAGERLDPVRWLSDRKETKPPARFSEASLVKALEENGVGRPSTYAQTIEVLVDRNYATRAERQLVPTMRGEDVNDWLVKNMPELFDVGYTAAMEGDLDKVEAGEARGDDMLSAFYGKFTGWLKAAVPPPPPNEKFTQLFDFFGEVTAWRAPITRGKFTYDDRKFVESVRKQMAEGKLALSEKQLQALVKLAISYREQVSDGEMRLIDMGWGPELDAVKNAPSEELVKWCFNTIDRIGGLSHNPFLTSLREQVDRGRMLSSKQFAILARSVGENAGALEDCAAVRKRLEPYVPGGFEVEESDPAVPELLKLLAQVKTWKEPARRGRRTYDDHEFVTSLGDQFARRGSLSPRQAMALRRVCVIYRDQIPDFEGVADRLGLRDIQLSARASSAERDARKDAREAMKRERKGAKSKRR